jgi:ABC-2 type transport system ATP-binding protein
VAAVEVERLTVHHGNVVAVEGVSFSASAGEVTTVLGPNGAGKTSTIEVCEGYRRPTAGMVRVLGFDPATQQRQLSKRMGVMLQEGGIYPSSKVLETVRHYAALYDNGADAAALVEAVGLATKSNATWRKLSGGEQQRVSLALALAAKPDVAFLDEPTSGIDINGRDAIRGIIRDLAANGCAVVLATHELDEAERLADRMVIIDHGTLIADATLAELRKGHDEIRFRTDPELDLRALAEATGIVASKVGNDEYVIDAPPQPRLMAQLGDWLAEAGHPLHDLRAGGQRLEDVFRRLTGGDQR